MYDMNLSTLKLKDGSEVSVGKKFYAAAATQIRKLKHTMASRQWLR